MRVLVKSVHMTSDYVKIVTTEESCEFDLSGVKPAELNLAKRVLEKMNFDKAFKLRFE